MINQLTLTSEAETAMLAAVLAQLVEPVDAIALQGTLGAGKTSLVRSLIRALSPEAKTGQVVSPSFMLMQQYDVQLPDTQRTALWHIDGYRLENKAEIQQLGLEELAENSILCIEWPEKLVEILPNRLLVVKIEIIEHAHRLVSFKGRGTWQTKVAQIAPLFYDSKLATSHS